MDSSEAAPEEFQQIFVLPVGKRTPKVTFDDNRNNNEWGYHRGKNTPHITEVFQIVASGGLKVKLYGLHWENKALTKWNLSVRESFGIPETCPRFRPQFECMQVGQTIIHTEFTKEVNGKGLTALSFKTGSNQVYYLMPTTTGPKKIVNDPGVPAGEQYVFIPGPKMTQAEVEENCKSEEKDS